jgi:hypothetical protein
MKEVIISLVTGLITGLVTALVTINTNNKNIWSESVSKSRMDWIVRFREEISIIVGSIQFLQQFKEKEIKIEGKDKEINTEDKDNVSQFNIRDIIYNALKARSSLLTRLNTNFSDGNEFNSSLTKLLNDIDFFNISALPTNYDNEIINITKDILEPEWQKVKKEAKGDVRYNG